MAQFGREKRTYLTVLMGLTVEKDVICYLSLFPVPYRFAASDDRVATVQIDGNHVEPVGEYRAVPFGIFGHD